jgi:hypothetical protein
MREPVAQRHGNQGCSGLITEKRLQSGNLTKYMVCRHKMINESLTPQFQRDS